MKASTKGIIGATLGAVIMTSIGMYSYFAGGGEEMEISMLISTILGMAIGGAILGFGYTFGWQYVKSFTAKALGVAVTGSVITIIFSRKDTLLKCIFIYAVALSIGIGIAYLPGIIKGIQLISQERSMGR